MLLRPRASSSQWLASLHVALFFAAAPAIGHAEDVTRFQIRHPAGVGEIFHGGVYTYLGADPVAAENHIRKLAQMGLTHLYVVPQDAEEAVLWCRKYGCRASNQVSAGYLANNGVIDPGAAAAIGDEIDTLRQYPEYMTTSVREEPLDQQSFIDTLFNYYATIDSNVASGTAPFYLLHNTPGAAAKAAAKTYKPLMTGYDRTYLYIWNYDVTNGQGTIGLLMHPRRAMFQIDMYLGEFMPHVNTYAQWPVAVLLGAAATATTSKQELANRYDGGQLDGANYTRWKQLASLGGSQANQGLKLNGDGSLTSSSYYMPPPNCMSAQVWLSVARGYRGVFSWLSQPAQNALPELFDLNGPAHKGSATQDELATTVRELQKFGWLINHMQPAAAAYISYPPPPYIPTTYSGSFTIPGYSGKVAVLVNNDVATWANSEGELTPTSIFRIDDNGNVNPSDYTPKTAARSITVTNTSGGGTMYDVETGATIGTNSGNVGVLPGKGKFIFIGTSTELASLRAKCGITSITAVSGLVPNREQIAANVQIVHASDPKIDSSNYFFLTQNVPLNKRYRIVVTASSTNGSTLGVMTGYNQGGNIVASHIRSANDGGLLWNRALSATPTTFTSEDFTISSGSLGYTWFYRANQAGTIKIHDAWLEDCNTHRVIATTGWQDTNAFSLSGGASYQLYARARNYPFESTPATLGVQIQEFNASGTLLGTYTTSPAISGAALSAQAKVFQATFAKQHASAVSAKVKFVNPAGAGTLLLESASVGRTQ